MRPYLAIIVDSFRAAIASRVLYILLALITLLFLLVGPLHVVENLDWRVKQFANPDAIVKRLIERGESGRTKSTTRVWSLLSEDTQATVLRLYETKEYSKDQLSDLVDELNTMIQDPSFYREEDWDRFSVVPEAKEILKSGYENLNESRMRRVNRLLIGKALPKLAKPNVPTMSFFYWFYHHAAWDLDLSQQQIGFYASAITTNLFDNFLLSIGLLVGIVVTANVMPQMFDPGALNLLLSKPITRAGLYLTRFAGGCTQIAICAAYLFTGTWLWLGLGLGVWDQAFLWSIPIYVLVFAIYYSVSALVGLVYRSPILSVVATVVFWATCFAVGLSYNSFYALMQNQRLYDPLVTEDATIAIDGLGNLVTWEADTRTWSVRDSSRDEPSEVAQALGIARFFGKLRQMPNQIRPTADPRSEQIIAGRPKTFPPQPTGFDSYEGYASDQQAKRFLPIGNFPDYTMAMFPTSEGFLLCERNGNFKRWDSTSNDTIVAESAGPDEPARLLTAYSIAMNRQNQEIVVHEIADDQHHVVIFKPTDDDYARDRSTVIDLGTEAKIKCFVAYANNTIVVVGGNGRIVAVDATTMESQSVIPPSGRTGGIETIASSPDGKWIAMVYANQQLWLMDVDNDRKLYRPSVTGSGNTSSVSFDADSRLCVFDRENRLKVYETASLEAVQSLAPADSVFEMSYRYLVSPLYTVFPKPGEFNKVTSYLSSAQNTEDNASLDLIFRPTVTNPLSPLWSGLGFMVLMLGLSCWIFHRKDF